MVFFNSKSQPLRIIAIFQKMLDLFFREFQSMTSTSDDSFLSSDQNTNQFLVLETIEPQISYSTIRSLKQLFLK